MSAVVHLIHGFNVWKPERTVGKLAPYFLSAGLPTNMVNYLWTGLYLARKRNSRVAARLCKVVRPDDIVVGHSNGCAIIKLALDLGMVCQRAILIHPALPVSVTFPERVARIDVWHDASDVPVKWAAILSSLIPDSWFAARPWGAAGAYGINTRDARIHNHNESACGFPDLGHSGLFRWDVLPLLGPKVVALP